MGDVVDQSFTEPRFNMLLVSAFAVLALVLSSIGIYGVIAYSVAQRTQEIGVRMALGANRLDVVRLVVAEGIAIAAVGISAGLAGALALTRVMRTMLVGVSPHDPLTFSAGAFVLLMVAVAASCFPALRAARVEPVAALRAE
jgi:ABC-type antimicrobial peptide transport system permease subunit